MTTEGEETKPRPPMNRIQLIEEKIGLPALFVSMSTFIGLAAGFITGGVTAVITNLAETPMARPHILRTTRTFGMLGVVHGVVGAGVILARGKDDFTNRAVSGCASGIALGISQGKVGMACGMCVGLAALSMFEKATSTMLTAPYDPTIPKTHQSLDPIFRKDERTGEIWKGHLEFVKTLETSKPK